MQQKTLLLASFVNEDKLQEFLEKIKKKFGIKHNYVFFFKTEEGGFILTYKIRVDTDKKIDIRRELPKTIQVHKKGSTIFTINALNKLIELENGLSTGNINHKEYQLDWSKFTNKIILLKDDGVEITSIEQVFLPES
jgi:hypothetical protein